MDPIDETKVTAKLPNLDVEMTRRELPEENAETITLRLRATPSFEAFAGALLQPNHSAFAPFIAAWLDSADGQPLLPMASDDASHVGALVAGDDADGIAAKGPSLQRQGR